MDIAKELVRLAEILELEWPNPSPETIANGRTLSGRIAQMSRRGELLIDLRLVAGAMQACLDIPLLASGCVTFAGGDPSLPQVRLRHAATILGRDTSDGPVSTGRIAALAGVTAKTVNNRLSESRKLGTAPEPTKVGNGASESIFGYQSVRPWAIATWPQRAEYFPVSFVESERILPGAKK